MSNSDGQWQDASPLAKGSHRNFLLSLGINFSLYFKEDPEKQILSPWVSQRLSHPMSKAIGKPTQWINILNTINCNFWCRMRIFWPGFSCVFQGKAWKWTAGRGFRDFLTKLHLINWPKTPQSLDQDFTLQTFVTEFCTLKTLCKNSEKFTLQKYFWELPTALGDWLCQVQRQRIPGKINPRPRTASRVSAVLPGGFWALVYDALVPF